MQQPGMRDGLYSAKTSRTLKKVMKRGSKKHEILQLYAVLDLEMTTLCVCVCVPHPIIKEHTHIAMEVMKKNVELLENL